MEKEQEIDIKVSNTSQEVKPLDSPTPNVEEVSSHKRIAKNTLMLYFRMFITLIIGLFTSRVVLNTLGVEDYGIYNVVGGLVSMFSLVSGSISAAISRFITFELGTGNIEKLKRVFSTSVNVQIALVIILFIVAEIVGIWFLNNEIKIPEGRMPAAYWVFHCSVITFAVSLISMPFNASIMAHEHMGVYAYITIFETLMKLVIVYMLYISPFDKLETYATLMLVIAIIVQLIYQFYCKHHFVECRYRFIFDKALFYKMFGFAGWNTIGAVSGVLRGQGNNILLNIFSGGTVVNAAVGIATTLTGVVTSFTGNFMIAFNPQITKNYAAKKYSDLISLLHRGAKFSAYLLLFFAIPVMLNTEYIFKLWLGVVPQHTVHFVRLILIYSLCEVFSRPLITAKLATGEIRNYQIVVGGIQLLSLPFSYILLKLGAPVEAVYYANILVSIMAFFARMIMLRGDIPQWSSSKYVTDVFFKVIIVAIIAAILPSITYFLLNNQLTKLILSSTVSIISSPLIILYMGCNKNERNFIINKVKDITAQFLYKIKRK